MKRINHIKNKNNEYTKKELLNGYCIGNFKEGLPKREQGRSEEECQQQNNYKSCFECWHQEI